MVFLRFSFLLCSFVFRSCSFVVGHKLCYVGFCCGCESVGLGRGSGLGLIVSFSVFWVRDGSLEYFCSDCEAIFRRYTDGLYVLPALFFRVVPNLGVAWACEDSV